MVFPRQRNYPPFKRGYAKPFVRHVPRLMRDNSYAKLHPFHRIVERFSHNNYRIAA